MSDYENARACCRKSDGLCNFHRLQGCDPLPELCEHGERPDYCEACLSPVKWSLPEPCGDCGPGWCRECEAELENADKERILDERANWAPLIDPQGAAEFPSTTCPQPRGLEPALPTSSRDCDHPDCDSVACRFAEARSGVAFQTCWDHREWKPSNGWRRVSGFKPCSCPFGPGQVHAEDQCIEWRNKALDWIAKVEGRESPLKVTGTLRCPHCDWQPTVKQVNVARVPLEDWVTDQTRDGYWAFGDDVCRALVAAHAVTCEGGSE